MRQESPTRPTQATEVILGVPVRIDGLQTDLLRDVVRRTDRVAPFVVGCVNPHSLVEAQRNPNFRAALMGADCLLADGTGIILASWVLGGKIRRRMTGSDLFEQANVALSVVSGSCYLLGATPETLQRLAQRMSVAFPGLRVVGHYSPAFVGEFTESQNLAMVDAVNAARPDVLWVGLGAPKQELWIQANRNRLDVPLIGAVGAVFDFYAGSTPRPGRLLRSMGLEWLGRLAREPRRLWRRTFLSAPAFAWAVLRERLDR